ncbi:MAG TPA: protein-L-isoaspartate O-methyltransferase, partial [Holophagaceae bacterium]|nr:protein-L-isoaspartate O-methyltransferase [Holophagaceae bacterium]
AMEEVPRHRFAPPSLLGEAHSDWPLPIGLGQTLSQPYIVAFMAEALELGEDDRVLEVGAGSGYAAAVLARIAREVWAMELEAALGRAAEARLAELGISNVRFRVGDGALGWPEAAPFDAILLSCAALSVPPALWEQLAPGGRLLLPIGSTFGPQDLVLYRKDQGLDQGEPLLPVRFVPLR